MGKPGTFGSLLLERGLVTSESLARAQDEATGQRTELVDTLVTMRLVDEDVAYQLLAQAAGMEFVALAGRSPSTLALSLVPERIARRYAAVALEVDNRTLLYATSRPFDAEAERDLGFASGRRAKAVVARHSEVQDALERVYPKHRALDTLAGRLGGQVPLVEVVESVQASPSEAVVSDLCNRLIGEAVEHEASDIHIDVTNEGAAVRYRTCGVLEPVLTLPAGSAKPVCNRFKVLAKIGTAVRRPQEGAFTLKVNGQPIDVRLSSLPTVDGEKLAMRVVNNQSPLQPLEHLGYDEQTLDRLKQSLGRPEGLILVAGSTGSGKTTALYAALGYLRTRHSNVMTVEDPVERTVPGVTQIAVNARAGNTLSAVLRSLLRQNPNVIMVGEVRDDEAAQIVGQAAFTGHLVLTSLQTADAAGAIARLTSLSLDPFKIAESLAAVLAQRLVRRLCPDCSRRHNDIEARRQGAQHGLASIPCSAGPGCPACKQTGYRGKLPVAELLTPTESLRAAIARGATAPDIRRAMKAAGFASLRERALDLVAAGLTSIDEVNRVLAADEDGTQAPRANVKTRVLVTDDDPITRMLVKLLLEREQYEVLEAVNGRDGLEATVRERPDLLLIDLNMPEMDGYEAISAVRKRLVLATLPIVVLTAEDGPGVERRVLELGADDYIVKPFDAEVLLSRVNAVFRRMKAIAS